MHIVPSRFVFGVGSVYCSSPFEDPARADVAGIRWFGRPLSSSERLALYEKLEYPSNLLLAGPLWLRHRQQCASHKQMVAPFSKGYTIAVSIVPSDAGLTEIYLLSRVLSQFFVYPDVTKSEESVIFHKGNRRSAPAFRIGFLAGATKYEIPSENTWLLCVR